MSGKVVSLVETDRFETLSVPPMRSRRGAGDLVSARYDALVQLASGLSGTTLDDVASRLGTALGDALEFDVLHIVMLGGHSAPLERL
jgi:hypothetical protein